MDFGRRIMEKYGYKEGSGLGKDETGIKAPVKASFKFDQTGLGGKDEVSTQDHWWDRVYTEATSNVNVNSNNGEVSIDLHDKDGVEITNKSYSMKKLKESGTNLKYGNFLKSATLLTGGEKDIEGHVSTVDIEIKPFKVINDDELFKACDGRTAHKGARHGLNLSGKLQRIAEQEKLFLKQRNDAFKASTAAAKKPLIELNSSKEDNSNSDDDLPLNLEEKHQSKVNSRTRKRQIEKVKKITFEIDSFNFEKKLQESPVKEKSLKQRRKDKKKLKRDLEEVDNNNDDAVNEVKKKKKKKSILDDDEDMIDSILVKEPKHVKKIGYKLDSFHISPSKTSSKKVRITTPIRNKKKSKKRIDPLPELTEDNEHSSSKRHEKDDDDDDDESKEKCSVSKRVKLDDEAFYDDADDIDKINSIHHQNVPFKHKVVQVENDNFESSSKKDKKKSKKKKDNGFSTKEWELKQNKKHENLEKKKQKRLKNMERRDGKLSAQKLKKLAKQQLLASKMEIS